ncbi:HET-C-related protein [Cystobacter fuscus]|uniref:HET-C-related protein n=1 Tax=Cystobacter fuscus TaxID=43 RepID=UPI002B29A90D|nr:LysM peptidoglycan-binding domain-containing protein [Cystobacter fuscus]
MTLPSKDSLTRPLLVPGPASSQRNAVVPRGRANPFRASIVGSSWVEVAGETLQSSLAQEELHSLVTSMTPDELLSWLRLLFGEDIPPSAFQRLRTAVLDGSLPQPRLVIVRDAIDGHPAAYHGKSRSILLSRELVLRARSDNTEAWKLLVCLTEEYGHHVDQMLRTHYSSVGGDAHLDEGARMAYSLIDFGYSRGQRHREFARHTTATGTVALEVEFGAMTAAVQRFVSAPEQWEDSRAKSLEYFGAGRGSGRAGSYGHESIEDSLNKAGFGDADRKAIYFGNWLRDHSQLIDPKIIRRKDQPVTKGLARESVTRIVDVLAREKFGNAKRNNVPVFQVTPQRLGVYRNEEHIDNPNGITDQRSIDPAFRGACRAEELAVNSLQMKNFIRSKGFSGGQPPRTHRVKDGDTLDSIARANGLTWQELARYNFGTDVTAEVSRQLYSKVGCRKKTHDGHNYIFTSQDSPGLIQIPGVNGGLAQEAAYSAFHFMSNELRAAVKLGRSSEGYRHFGHALHTLEDFFSHTNFVELMLIQLGAWVEPWVPQRGAKAGDSRPLVLTSGMFGGLDTMASLTLGIAESMQKEHECIAGEATAGSKIALILLEDQGYIEARDMLGGLLERLHELERKYPVVATLSCETIGVVLRSMKSRLGGIVHSAGSIIDDAQTAFLSNPNSTDPTHSQLAKDHDDHPLHALAANLAAGAVLDVGKTLQRAWLGKATADEVVLTAAHYFLHPAHLDPKSNAGWMRDHVQLWIPGHRETLTRLGSKSWMAEWTKQSSQHLKKMMARARQLMGGARQ